MYTDTMYQDEEPDVFYDEDDYENFVDDDGYRYSMDWTDFWAMVMPQRWCLVLSNRHGPVALLKNRLHGSVSTDERLDCLLYDLVMLCEMWRLDEEAA